MCGVDELLQAASWVLEILINGRIKPARTIVLSMIGMVVAWKHC